MKEAWQAKTKEDKKDWFPENKQCYEPNKRKAFDQPGEYEESAGSRTQHEEEELKTRNAKKRKVNNRWLFLCKVEKKKCKVPFTCEVDDAEVGKPVPLLKEDVDMDFEPIYCYVCDMWLNGEWQMGRHVRAFKHHKRSCLRACSEVVQSCELGLGSVSSHHLLSLHGFDRAASH